MTTRSHQAASTRTGTHHELSRRDLSLTVRTLAARVAPGPALAASQQGVHRHEGHAPKQSDPLGAIPVRPSKL